MKRGVDWRITKKDFNKKIFKMNFSKIDYDFHFPSLKGEHQIENASTAAATAISINNKKLIKKLLIEVFYRQVSKVECKN